MCLVLLLVIVGGVLGFNATTDQLALLRVRAALIDPHNLLSNWITTNTLCSWEGVSCTSGRVDNVDWEDTCSSSQYLSGRLSTFIGQLNLLTILRMGSGCQLSGTLPTELGLLTLLQRISIENNRYSGPMPTQLGLLTALTHMDWSDNFITGMIPSVIGILTKLTKDEILLDGNMLTGSVPSQIESICNSLGTDNADFSCNLLAGPSSSKCMSGLSACSSCPVGSSPASQSVAPGQCVYTGAAASKCIRPFDTLSTTYSLVCRTPVFSGQYCTPQCNAGYFPIGNLTMMCASGTWSSAGYCGTVNTNCTRPSDTSSTSFSTSPQCPLVNMTSSSTCVGKCNSGYWQNGSLSQTCTSGVLSAPLGSCVGNNCTRPPDTASISFSTACSNPILSGAVCTPTCKTGTSNTGGSLSQTCTLGVLSNPVGTCTPNNCVRPADTASTLYSTNCINPIGAGTSCSPVCAAGYAANSTGVLTISCNYGVVSQTDPLAICAEKPCARPADTSSTIYSLSCSATVAAGAVCTPQCASGFNATGGSLAQTCHLGTLSSPAGTCQPSPCKRPADTNSTVYSTSCTNPITSSSTCVPACSSGYTANGTLSQTCTLGVLSSPGGFCNENPCARPTDASSTTYSTSPYCPLAIFPPGSTCTPLCAFGYAPTGGALNQTCRKGVLSTPPGSCQLVNVCSSNPCNNGTCTQTGPGVFSCYCLTGYLPPTCLSTQDNCSPNPCANGGNCSNTGPATYSCSCTTYYTGPTCSTVANLCSTNNGGCDPLSVCTNNAGGPPTCGACPVGFTGTGYTQCRPNAPTIATISPPGVVAGATVVGITGADFGTNPAALSIYVVAGSPGAVHLCVIQPASLTGSYVSCVFDPATPPGVYYINMTHFITTPVAATLNGSSFYSGVAVTILNYPLITSLQPGSGQSGTTTVVLGSGFGVVAANVQVTFDGIACPVSSSVTDGQLTCIAPPHATGLASVVVAVLGISSQPPAPTFTYLPAVVPTIYSVAPQGVTAGTTLSILGGQFGTNQSDIFVSITNATSAFPCLVIPGSLLSDGSYFLCRLAPSSINARPGSQYLVNVTIGSTLAQGLFYVSVVLFPTVASVSPLGGRGGSFVTVTGTNFEGAANTFVYFASSVAPIYITLSNSSFVVVAPPLLDGPANVQVCVFGQSVCSVAPFLQYLYIQPVAISSLTPTGGVDQTAVQLFGSNLGLETDMTVLIGGVGCPIVHNSVTLASFRCTFNGTGLMPGNSYFVQIFRFEIAAVGPLLFYNYIIPPTIGTVTPLGGLPGSAVSLSGINFGYVESDLSILIGSTTCGIIYGSLNGAGTSLSCLLPSVMALGVYPVTLFRIGVAGLNNNVFSFTVIAAPAVTAVKPRGGAQLPSQPTVLTITGVNFGTSEGNVAVTVGSFACPLVAGSLWGSSSVQCVVADTSGVVGPSDVIVTLYRTTSSAPNSAAVFNFINAPVVTVINPPASMAGHLVTVSGFNFGSVVADLSVALLLPQNGSSSVASTPCLIVATSLDIQGSTFTCALPPLLQPLSADPAANTFNISVMRYHVPATFSSGSMAIQYISPPTITGMQPPGCLTQGGIAVTIYGTGFAAVPSALTVLVNNQYPCVVETSTMPVSDGVFACIVPGLISGGYFFSVARYDVVSANSWPFQYFDTPIVTSVTPGGGVTGAVLTVSGANFGLDSSILQATLGPFHDIACAVVAGSLLTVGTSSTFSCVLGNYTDADGGVNAINIGLFGQVFGSGVSFDIVSPLPNITSLDGSRGVIGTQVDVIGVGFGSFESALAVFVGTGGDECLVVTGSLNLAGTQFSCRMPSASKFDGAGYVEVSIARWGVPADPSDYAYFNFISAGFPPIVFSLSPAGGLWLGTIVTINGANFATNPPATVSLGVDNCPVVSVVSSVIVCNTSISSGIAAGTALDVIVTSYGMHDNQPHSQFYVGVVFPPHVSQVAPAGGEAGDLLTLHGNGFASESATVIDVGYFPCPIVPGSLTYSLQGQTVVCTVQANFPGISNVFVTSAGIAATLPYPTFLYPLQPLIQSVFPMGGLPGFTNVTVYSRNVPTNADTASGITLIWRCDANTTGSTSGSDCAAVCNPTIGSTDASGLVALLCLLPPMVCGGSVDPSILAIAELSVDVFGVESSPATFFYADAMPVVSSVTPAALTPNTQGQGALMTIVGGHFGYPYQPNLPSTVAVTVGGSDCGLLPSLRTVSYLVCEMPPSFASVVGGYARVEVTAFESLEAFAAPGGGGTNGNDYYYFPVIENLPVVSGVSPSIVRPGDMLTLTGAYFSSMASSPLYAPTSTLVRSKLLKPYSGPEAVICPIVTLTSTQIVCEVGAGSNTTATTTATGGPRISFNTVSFALDVYGLVGAFSAEAVTFYRVAFYLPFSAPIVLVFLAIYAILAVVIVATMYIYYVHRKDKIFRPQSPLFCEIICLGLLIALAAALLFSGKPARGVCAARMWLLAIGFTLTFGVLFVKSYRINKIFNYKHVRRIVITDNSLLLKVLLMLVVDFALLTAFTVSMPAPALAVSQSLGEVYWTCVFAPQQTYPVALLTLVIYKVTSMLYGMYLAFMNRNVTSAYNESKHIAFCIYIFAALIVLVAPTAALLQSDPTPYFAIIAVACLIVVVSFWVSLFGFHVYTVLFRRSKVDGSDDFDMTGTMSHNGSKESFNTRDSMDSLENTVQLTNASTNITTPTGNAANKEMSLFEWR